MTKQDKQSDIWQTATVFAGYYGVPPSSFSTLIRGLGSDSVKNNDEISHHNRTAMLRFLKGASVLCPFYFYLKTFKADFFVNTPQVGPASMLEQFRASELAAFLATLYTYRRTKILVEDISEWKIISENIKQNSELCALVGYRLEQVEPELGLLVGAFRYIAWAGFLAKDVKKYQEYRRYLKKHNLPADSGYEIKHFGCSSSIIAAHLLIGIGYSREIAQSISEGLSINSLPNRHQFPCEYQVKLCELWSQSLLHRQAEPELEQVDKFGIDSEKLSKLIEESRSVCNNYSKYHWLDKCKSDLSPEQTPELFKDSQIQISTPSSATTDMLLDQLSEDFDSVND